MYGDEMCIICISTEQIVYCDLSTNANHHIQQVCTYMQWEHVINIGKNSDHPCLWELVFQQMNVIETDASWLHPV